MRPNMLHAWLQRCWDLDKYQLTLSQFILFLSDNLILDEQEGEERRDHIVEGTDSSNDIVVIDIFVLSDWKLSMFKVDLPDPILDVLIFRVAQQSIID